MIATYFFVPDMTGVDLGEEDAKIMQYPYENGWVGDVGEADATQPIDLVMRSRSGVMCWRRAHTAPRRLSNQEVPTVHLTYCVGHLPVLFPVA